MLQNPNGKRGVEGQTVARRRPQHDRRAGAEFVGAAVIRRKRKHLGAGVDADNGAIAPVDQFLCNATGYSQAACSIL
jgi:hypothetical protein